jgi:hypothetical protein
MDRLMDLTDGDGDATKIDQDETEITGLVPTGDWIGQARIAPLPPAAAPQHPALTLGEGGREEGMGMWLALRLHVVRLVALSPTFGRSQTCGGRKQSQPPPPTLSIFISARSGLRSVRHIWSRGLADIGH